MEHLPVPRHDDHSRSLRHHESLGHSTSSLVPLVGRDVSLYGSANLSEEDHFHHDDPHWSPLEPHTVAPDTFFGCIRQMLIVAIPATITIAFTFCSSIIPLAMVGKLLGEKELNGASVGYFLVCILIQYPMMGMTYAIDTLCSHEFGRRGYTPQLGLILQRGLFVNSVVLVPLCIGLYFVRPLLNHFYGVEVAGVAMDFLYYCPLYLYAFLTLVSCTKFLNNQQKAYVPTMALTVGVVLTPFVQYALTMHGIRYTMLGMAITTWLQVAVMVAVTLSMEETRKSLGLGQWSLRQLCKLSEMRTYFRFGIPSAIFVAAEASSLDLSILLAASYGVSQGSAFSSIMNTLFVFASITGGISTSACANIGRCIGAHDAVGAKRFVRFSLCATVFMTLCNACVVVTFFNFFMSLFGTYGTTLELARSILGLIVVLQFGDSVQYVFQGIFSGLGKNNLGAKILLSSVWGVGIPMCFLLGNYFGMQMPGVVIGVCMGIYIENPVMLYYVLFDFDYHELCMEHKQRVAAEERERQMEMEEEPL